MSATGKNIRSIFCPYYINIDRLIDISASISDGYSDYKDIETFKVASKTKFFSGKHSNKIFLLVLKEIPLLKLNQLKRKE